MKRALLAILLLLVFACARHEDPLIAEVYNTRLYASEISELIPTGLSKEDSVKISLQIIDEWIKKQVILHEAQETLSIKEKNFQKEIENLKNDLLLNAYFLKITADSTLFPISSQEIDHFLEQFDTHAEDETEELIKLNYVRLSPSSSILKEVKAILFDDNRRLTEKTSLEKLCSDSLEYFIEDNTWLRFDDILHELPITLNEESLRNNQNQNIEKQAGEYTYIMVLLDYKVAPSATNISEKRAAARNMLEQKKKSDYIQEQKEKLLQKALEKGKITKN